MEAFMDFEAFMSFEAFLIDKLKCSLMKKYEIYRSATNSKAFESKKRFQKKHVAVQRSFKKR